MNQLKLSKLISEEQLKERIQAIGDELTKKFDGKDVVAICVFKGSFIFYADLIRQVNADISCEFFGVSSYQNNTQSSGEVKLTLDLAHPIEGKDVLLVEDIVDSGLTMNYLQKTLEARLPKSITTVALLHKPDAAKVDYHVDITGFEIKNDFVVGYGLDYQGYHRNLPYIARIENLN